MHCSEYRFITKLSRHEVKSLVSKQRASVYSGGGILGKSHGDKLELKYIFSYNNSWAPIFYASITSCAEGTLISGRFAVNPLIKILMRAIRGMMIFMSVIILFSMVSNGFQPMIIFFAAIPLLMYAASLAIEKFCIYLGKNGVDKILIFIEDMLLAKVTQC